MHIKTEIKRVRVGDLIVDPHVQGKFNPAAVKRMARNYRAEAIGILHVSVRDDGSLHVMDGQHRRALEIAVKGENHMVTAKLYHGLSTAQEAEMFVRLNDAHAPSIKDKFHNRLVYGDPSATEIVTIARQYGYDVDANSSGPFKISAIGALESVFNRRGGDVALARSLQVINLAWCGLDGATEGHLIRGFGLFFATYGDQIDIKSLTDRIAKNWTPNRLLAKARSDLTSTGSLGSYVARELVRIYNSRRHPKNRLEVSQ